MLSTSNNLLTNNGEFDFGFNCLDAIKLRPKLLDSDHRDIGCFDWNNLLLYLTRDYVFFNFDELCRCFKRRKIKTWDNSSTWKSCFNTHFVKPKLQAKHPDRFKVLHGDQYVHVMYLEKACEAFLKGIGEEWFWGEPDCFEGCGEGYIYFIWFVHEDKFKFGKADDYEVRFTNYLSEIKDRKAREAGFKVLWVFKVKNMSLSEDTIDLYWKKAGFKNASNSREYYKVPLLKGETENDRYYRIADIINEAIVSIEPDKEWIGDTIEEANIWESARLKLPAK